MKRFFLFLLLLIIAFCSMNFSLVYIEGRRLENFLAQEHMFLIFKAKIKCAEIKNDSKLFWKYRAKLENCYIMPNLSIISQGASNVVEYFIPDIEIVDDLLSKSSSISFSTMQKINENKNEQISIEAAEPLTIHVNRESYLSGFNSFELQEVENEILVKDVINDKALQKISNLFAEYKVIDSIKSRTILNKVELDITQLSPPTIEGISEDLFPKESKIRSDISLTLEKYSQEELKDLISSFGHKEHTKMPNDMFKSLRYDVNKISFDSDVYQLLLEGNATKYPRPGFPKMDLHLKIDKFIELVKVITAAIEIEFSKAENQWMLTEFEPKTAAEILLKILKEGKLLVGDTLQVEIKNQANEWPTLNDIALLDLLQIYQKEFIKAKARKARIIE